MKPRSLIVSILSRMEICTMAITQSDLSGRRVCTVTTAIRDFTKRIPCKLYKIICINILLLITGCSTPITTDEEYDPCSDSKELQQFANKILSDPSTFEMDFKNEQDSLDIEIVESPDKKLRFYSWESICGTTVTYKTICQTRTKRKVRTFDWRNDTPLTYCYRIYAIRQIESPQGTIYLIYNHSGEHMYPVFGVDAFKLNKLGKLVPVEIFEKEGSLTGEDATEDYYSRVEVAPFMAEVPSLFEDGGWFDNYFFDLTGEDIYIPVQDKENSRYANLHFNDYYHRYHWNGKKFNYEFITFNPALEKFIKGPYKMVCEFELGKLIVRIDEMEDGTLRYIAWKRDRMFVDAPDLIIENGWYHEVQHVFYFTNRNYEYVLKLDMDNEDYIYERNAHLHIYQTDPKAGEKTEIANYTIEYLNPQL